MIEHKYAQVLRWIAEKKKVQSVHERGELWGNFPEDFTHDAVAGVLSEQPGWSFRLAPRTVKVGDVEIEAALNEPYINDRVCYIDNYGECRTESFSGSRVHTFYKNSGLLFSTPDAAEAAHAAWVKLMRGDA